MHSVELNADLCYTAAVSAWDMCSLSFLLVSMLVGPAGNPPIHTFFSFENPRRPCALMRSRVSNLYRTWQYHVHVIKKYQNASKTQHLKTHILQLFYMILHHSICARDSNFSWDILGYFFARHMQHDDHPNKGRPFPCLCPMASSSLEGSPIHSHHLCRSHPNPLQESHKREKRFLVADLTKKNGCRRLAMFSSYLRLQAS